MNAKTDNGGLRLGAGRAELESFAFAGLQQEHRQEQANFQRRNVPQIPVVEREQGVQRTLERDPVTGGLIYTVERVHGAPADKSALHQGVQGGIGGVNDGKHTWAQRLRRWVSFGKEGKR